MREIAQQHFRASEAALTIEEFQPQGGDTAEVLLAKQAAIMAGATTQSVAQSTALEASRVIKAEPGVLAGVSVWNAAAVDQHVLILDAAAVPADGAVTLLYAPIPLPAGALVVVDFPRPLAASSGIVVCNSSTAPLKTAGAADCFFHAQFR